jgi:hypothetical protein
MTAASCRARDDSLELSFEKWADRSSVRRSCIFLKRMPPALTFTSRFIAQIVWSPAEERDGGLPFISQVLTYSRRKWWKSCYRRSDSFFDFHLNTLSRGFSPQRFGGARLPSPKFTFRTGQIETAYYAIGACLTHAMTLAEAWADNPTDCARG